MRESLKELIAEASVRTHAAMEHSSKPVLLFSGGKDSLACLQLLRPFWQRLTVVWANAGDPYPETEALMRDIAAMVGTFHTVRGDCLGDAAANGFPSDMVPLPATEFGRANVQLGDRFLVQASYACCARNFWQPLHDFTQNIGADLIIRGERDDEVKRSPVRDGDLDHLGRRLLLPVARWTKVDVLEYLQREGVALPRQYAYGLPSLDCMRCTAYLDESANKLTYLREFHPSVATDFHQRLVLVHQAQAREYRYTQIALGIERSLGNEGLAD